MTASRSGEVRQVAWSDVDWEKTTWAIPAERIKARSKHLVPLASRALEILERAGELGGGMADGLIFPANRSGRALSDMAFTVMLRR